MKPVCESEKIQAGVFIRYLFNRQCPAVYQQQMLISDRGLVLEFAVCILVEHRFYLPVATRIPSDDILIAST